MAREGRDCKLAQEVHMILRNDATKTDVLIHNNKWCMVGKVHRVIRKPNGK